MFKFSCALSFVALMAVIGLSSGAVVAPTVFRNAAPLPAPAILLPPREEFDQVDDDENEDEEFELIIEDGPDNDVEDLLDVTADSEPIDVVDSNVPADDEAVAADQAA